MTAFGADIFYLEPHRSTRIASVARQIPENALYGIKWQQKDSWRHEPLFTGISLHLSDTAREEYYKGLMQRYDRHYGNEVPDSFFHGIGSFIIGSNPDFYHYMRQSTGDTIKGVFVGVHNIKYLTRLNLVLESKEIESLVAQHGKEFIDELMTLERVMKTLSDDTWRWHESFP